MKHFIQDLAYAARLFGRHPAFTLLAVVTLALGVGATTAVFTVFNAVLLRPLPYKDPERLVVIRADALNGTATAALADAEIADLREMTRLFEEVAGLTAVNGDLTSREGDLPMERVSAASATDNLLPMLGATPSIGRLLDDRIDSTTGRVLSVVISHELWSRRFGADPQMVGRHVDINNMSLVVVGVLPQGFQLRFGSDTNIPARVDVWFPTGLGKERRYRGHTAVGRLAKGVSLDQARAELTSLEARINAAHPDVYVPAPLRLHANSLQADAAREAKGSLLLLFGAVSFVLLISCANVAHLLLTRTAARSRELAIRSAVGADRVRLLRQLLTEGAVLGLAGGGAGFLLAEWGEVLLTWLKPPSLPPVDLTLDARVLIFGLAVTFLASLLFSIAPALQAIRADVVDALKASGRSAGPRSRRLRTALIVSEVALTVVLLVAAGLMIRTGAALHAVDTGFDGRNVLTMRASMNIRNFLAVEKRWGFYRQALDRLQGLPGVQSLSAVRPLPLEEMTSIERFVPDDQPGREIVASSIATLPGYFQTLRIRLLQGRDFVAGDLDVKRSVVVVDRQFAAVAWPNEAPLGRRIHISRGGRELFSAEVIGVVDHVRANTLRDDRQPQVYLPYHQYPLGEMALAIRVAGDPRLIIDAARREIEALGGGRPVHRIRMMSDYVDDAAAESRFLVALLSIFAALALILATVGLYGVITYSAGLRTREIGIRLALGARPGDIVRLVIGDAMGSAATGMAIGIAAAILLTRSFRSLLFGVGAADPLTLTVVALVLSLVAVFASFVPARRATRVDPTLALQAE